MKVISKISIIIVAFLVGVRCIDRFDIKDAEKVSDILIVEGMIAEGVSNIILSKGYPLGQNISVRNYVNNAEVLVECSDGTVFSCNGEIIEGKYKIEIFDFKPQTQYRLRIKLDKKEYLSEYLSPLHTPEIDELKFTKNQRMDPISVQVSTHDPENQSRYYSWEYEEIWEIEAPLLCWYEFDENLNYTVSYSKDKNTPPICPRYYCWKYNNSLSFIFGHPREGEANIIKDLTLFEINPTSDKLSKLYYIKIKQTQVRKEYYDYFSSIIKNGDRGHTIFTPLPSELKGNIKCITNSSVPVIGYMDVATSTWIETFIESPNDLYVYIDAECKEYTEADFPDRPGRLPDEITPWDSAKVHLSPYHYQGTSLLYALKRCLDCRESGGSKIKPDFWPNDHE